MAAIAACLAFALGASPQLVPSRGSAARLAFGDVQTTGGFDPPLGELDGRAIYNRVLENRFRSYIQLSSLVSGDRAGNDQETRLRMWFKSFQNGTLREAEPYTLSKTLVKYTHPFDVRHSGYLIINNDERPNDQFVYLATNRRVRRVNLRGEAVFGTDFSFEDVIPKELGDADYTRLPDSTVNGVPCFVVEAIPKPYRRSEYSKLEIHIEKERSVPLRTRYWDERGLQVKRLAVERASIELIEKLWVPRRMTMEHLQLESYTTLTVVEIEPNAELHRTMFDLRRLEGH
ncbi:MAG: outer membrane lipoprotein-sorting protein [Myxococcota bacterium]